MLCRTNAAPRARWWGMVAAWAIALGAGCGASVDVTSGSGGAKGTTGSEAGATSGAGAGATTGTGAGAATTTGTSAASSSGAGATTGASSSTGGGTCSMPCAFELTCCDGACAELDNDLLNCGACGNVCTGPHPYCHAGKCEPQPTCMTAQPCPSADFCCGGQCCSPDEICCDSFGGPAQPNPHCTKPENGTCPHSCFACN